MSDDPNKAAELSDDEKALLVEKKATCPFIGGAIAQGKLPVRNNANDPPDVSGGLQTAEELPQNHFPHGLVSPECYKSVH